MTPKGQKGIYKSSSKSIPLRSRCSWEGQFQKYAGCPQFNWKEVLSLCFSEFFRVFFVPTAYDE